jgi:4-hydroxy-tetrahydrodipicolinate reductase
MPHDIILVGALGRMGAEIASIVLSDDTLKLRACVEYKGHPQTGNDYGVCIGRGPVGVTVVDSIESIDVAGAVLIDFSSLQSTIPTLRAIEGKECGIIVGTTGLGEQHWEVIRSIAKSNPVIASPNMSLGVNLLFSLTRLVAERLKDSFDIEIIEAHHRFKKDAPSGTARRLGEIVADVLEQNYEDCIKDGRVGLSDSIRSPVEVGMHAVRGGDIVGDHTVLFAGIGERIELRHMAHSRATFARGAVATAKWLANKAPGLYSMKDVLGL